MPRTPAGRQASNDARQSKEFEFVPIAEAAMRTRMTREMVLRRVQRGVLRGEQRDGKWYVALSADGVAA